MIDKFLSIFSRIFPHHNLLNRIQQNENALRNILGLVIFNALGGLLVMMTNVKLANVMGASTFGVYSYYLAIGEVGSKFVRYGREKTMLRELVQNPENRESLIAHTVWLECINLILFVLVAVACCNWLDAQVSWSYLLLIVTPCLISIDFQPVYEAFRLMSWHSIYYLIQKVLFLAGIWGVLWCVRTMSLASAAFVLFASWLTILFMQYREIIGWSEINLFVGIKARSLFALYKGGFTIALCCMVGVAFGPLVRLIMNHYVDTVSVGLYAACLQLITIAKFFMMQVGRVGNPRMAEICISRYTKSARVSFLKKYSLTMFFCVCPFAVPMLLCPKWIVSTLFIEEYAEISQALPVYAAYLFVSALGVVFNQFLISVRADSIYLYLYSFSAMVSLGIAFLMIPEYGFIGGVWAYCISDGLASVLYLICSLIIIKKQL
ncbi:oligosaccharide flippase family protein [uncultured Phocaeicola sp.]|uniref:oligosaccharide flippase family protein n=1 Tax=uncultured Phocaeicola sp. TaxID=990718 RepID=UPI00260F8B23|nr:oligosaccharide flippase family protein [uncultured Phocaeicola sp.]